jgi:anti-anti-sigma factor
MRIETQLLADTLVYRFTGKAKLHEWEEATQDIVEQYENGVKSIIVNWRGIDKIDTSSLQVLVRLLKIQKRDPELEFYLVTNNPNHIKILKIFGFDQLVNITSTERKALELSNTP